MSTHLLQSTPSPLRGGIKGGGVLPRICGLSHPLPPSPVEGEVRPGGVEGLFDFPGSKELSPREKETP